MPFLADNRPTQFELARFQQGPNGIRVEMVERGVAGSSPPAINLADGSDPAVPADLDPQLVADWISVLARTEAVYAKRYADLVTATSATDPSKVHALVAQAMKAQADTKAAEDALATANAQAAAALAEHAALSLQISQMREQVASADVAEVSVDATAHVVSE